MRYLLRIAVVAAFRSLLAGAVFAILEEGKECFLIEQPLDTQLTVRYEIPALEALEVTGSEPDGRGEGGGASIAVKLTLVDRRTKSVVFSTVLDAHKGEASMATVSEANHDLCLRPVANSLSGPFRVDLEVERGHGDAYYARMAADNKMDKLQVEVVKLNDELAEILNEADYMKEKEVKFHKKAERVNLAAIWWPILQIAILVLTAVAQVHNLKSFFQAKHLY